MTSAERVEHLVAVFRRVHRALHSFHGVRYIDVGYRFRDDRRTRSLALRLFVESKRGKTKALRLAPPSIEGAPVDVIQCKVIPHAAEQDDFVGGSFISEKGQGPGGGTMGAAFLADAGSRMVALTARHVCPDVGTTVLLGRQNPEQIGTVSALNFDLGASVIALDPGLQGTVGNLGPLGTISRFATADDITAGVSSHARVRKNGATTGVTQALVTGFDPVAETVTFSASDGTSTIAKGGDSGAIWVTGDGVALAVHVAGDGPHAIGMFIGPMQTAFGLTL